MAQLRLLLEVAGLIIFSYGLGRTRLPGPREIRFHDTRVTALDFVLLLGGVASIDLSFLRLATADKLCLFCSFLPFFSPFRNLLLPPLSPHTNRTRKNLSLFSGRGIRFGHGGFSKPAPKVMYVQALGRNRRATGMWASRQGECASMHHLRHPGLYDKREVIIGAEGVYLAFSSSSTHLIPQHA